LNVADYFQTRRSLSSNSCVCSAKMQLLGVEQV
jgi:hypothetical protein